ncbi:hypothetical protein BJ138DRAFT_282285 [Hygrophoropsis aurantiaca]|uniref:Uncharacterized protein n=1 Tax=Hygrophoropsis aurantiaca TaxID=72124 RepID=A0ACB8A6Y3_9AGAM|nr:hypothetical protein BJ138DRAFT_282285 [Hygrophoropsis aurantiaca]
MPRFSWYRSFVFTLSASSLLVSVYGAGNTTCLSSQLDWYTDAVGESPCMTYQRLRQICDADYEVPSFRPNTPGDNCDSQNSDCCCNSVSFALSMLCMNCQQDAANDPDGIDAGNGAYWDYLSGTCSQGLNYTLPAEVQTAVCSQGIKISTYIYQRAFWSTGAW